MQALYCFPSFTSKEAAETMIKACGGQLLQWAIRADGNRDATCGFESQGQIDSLTRDLDYVPEWIR